MDKFSHLLNKHLKSNNLASECPVWEVKSSGSSSRGLFANRDIKAGEEILRDSPLFLGPRSGNNCPLICVNCYRKSNLRSCSKNCGLPVCSGKCENSATHRKECRVISRWARGRKFQDVNEEMLKCLTPIRALFLTEYQLELLKSLKAHRGPQHGFEVNILRKKLLLEVSEFEQNLLALTCSVLDTNAFEIIVGDEEEESSLRGIYPLSSLMNHMCTPNTMYSFDSNNNMLIKATAFISKGQELYHCYTKLLWATCVRQPFLIRTKHFLCKCARCRDPTEFGSYLGALNCLRCRGMVLPAFAKDLKMIWNCVQCKAEMPSDKAGIIMTMLGNRLLSFDASEPEEMLHFLKGPLLKYAPPCNQVAVQLKCRLVWALGYNQKYLWGELTADLLNEKETICRELLQLLETLGAGQSKMRGLLLYELFCCLRERRNRFGLQTMDGKCRNVLEDELKEMEHMFEESREILMDDVHAPREIKHYNRMCNGSVQNAHAEVLNDHTESDAVRLMERAI